MLLFLGLVLAAAAVAVGVGVVLANTGPATLTVYGETVPGVVSQWQVFLSGGGVAIVFIIGMMITFIGAGRVMRSRRDMKELRARHKESLTTLEMEKRRLEQELARARRAGAAQPGPAPSRPAPAPRPATGGPARSAAPASAPRSQVKAASPFFERE